MRLTNQDREDFVNSVMRSIPLKHNYPDSMAAEDAQKLAFATLPLEVQKLAKLYPNMLAWSTQYMAGMPTHKPDGSLNRRHAYYPSPVMLEDKPDLTGIIKKVETSDKEIRQRSVIRSELMSVVTGCTTLKQLQDTLPDLVSFMPKEKAKPMPVAIIPSKIINTLKASGLKLKEKA